jgi:HAD superfamily phosphoserine phosphatase-like hydrolase
VSTAFCFDLDGTITREEILPAIASELGLSEEMELLTSLTIRGLIPFESSFRLRCRILRDVPISRVREIVSSIPLDPLIETFIRENRERCAVVTGNLDVWVKIVLERLGCDFATSIGLARDDRLESISHILRKDEAVKALRARGFSRVVAIGEGFNDIPMFESSDIGVAFGGVHPTVPEILQLSRYVVFGSRSLCRLLNTL